MQYQPGDLLRLLRQMGKEINMEKLILASGSPRRKELLENAGYEFEIIVSHCEENYTSVKPYDVVSELALLKARDVAAKMTEDCLVIGADTIVAVDDAILGKPADEEDAVRMIASFQGRAHQVYTGLALVRVKDGKTEEKIFYECTDVHVVPMTEVQIRDYVATGECMDAAGSYKIQGGFGKYIDRFEGDRDNIIGFPVARFEKELQAFT